MRWIRNYVLSIIFSVVDLIAAKGLEIIFPNVPREVLWGIAIPLIPIVIIYNVIAVRPFSLWEKDPGNGYLAAKLINSKMSWDKSFIYETWRATNGRTKGYLAHAAYENWLRRRGKFTRAEEVRLESVNESIDGEESLSVGEAIEQIRDDLT
ncbi:MAG: hypothetical protein F4161_07460 [Gammaproteobacteria bacterium]|nr:hypothetical protein [Gammaproteobacteria bacterium]